MWAKRKYPRTACIIVLTEDAIRPDSVSNRDVQLNVGALDTEQRIQPVALGPCEPAPKLVGLEPVGVPGVPSQVRDRGQLSRCHGRRLERHESTAAAL